MSACAESDALCEPYPDANCAYVTDARPCITLIEEIAECLWLATRAEGAVILARIHALETMGGVCATKP